MFEQESLQNESMEKYIWNQPLEHPKMVSTKWENTTPFFRTNPARHKMMVYAGHVPTHFMPEISRGMQPSNWIPFPQGSRWKFKKYLSCHHPVIFQICNIILLWWFWCWKLIFVFLSISHYPMFVRCSPMTFFVLGTQMLNVWYIYLHLPPKLPKCR